MAVETVDALAELTSPATNDEVGIWDVSAGQFKKIQVANLLGATIVGGGTIALGGFTLTVPATGTAALLATANAFTAAQNITSSADGSLILYKAGDGNAKVTFNVATVNSVVVASHAEGTYGANVSIGRNVGGATAAGFINLFTRSGGSLFLWIDNAANLRVHNAPPDTSSTTTDTAGTVVGTQTSSLDSKDVLGAPVGIDDVLAAVQAGADAVRRFTYRSGAYNGEEFSGVVTDYAPRYGMDRDGDHPAGKSLNEITVIGDLLLAVADLAARVKALEAA